MFWRLSESIAHFMLPEGSGEDKEVYGYGVWLLLTTLYSAVEVLLLGYILHCLSESMIYLGILMILRTYTGGYHASTSGRCNVLVVGCFLMNLILSRCLLMLDSKIAVVAILLFAEVLIYYKAPVEHVNKPLSDEEKRRYRTYSIMISAAILLVIGCLYYRYKRQMLYMTVTMGMVGVMMLVELVLQRTRR